MSDTDPINDDLPNRRDLIHLADGATGADTNLIDVKQVTGYKGQQMIKEAMNSEAYSRIHGAIFSSMGYDGGDSLRPTAYVLKYRSKLRYAVSFMHGSQQAGTEISMAIPVSAPSGMTAANAPLQYAEGVVEHFQNGQLDEVETVRDRERGVETQRFEHPLDVSKDLPDVDESEFLEGSAACNGCKTVFQFVCSVGCGLGSALVCAALGVTGWGGIACSVVTSAVCFLISNYGCGPGSNWSCRKLNFCGRAGTPS